MTPSRFDTFLGSIVSFGPTLMIGLLVAERLFPKSDRRPSSSWKFASSAPTIAWILAFAASGMAIVAMMLATEPSTFATWLIGLPALGSLFAFTVAMTETFVMRHFLGSERPLKETEPD